MALKSVPFLFCLLDLFCAHYFFHPASGIISFGLHPFMIISDSLLEDYVIDFVMVDSGLMLLEVVDDV